jgi:cyclophilin family peptidyl-prolyl cis-trans isomerase
MQYRIVLTLSLLLLLALPLLAANDAAAPAQPGPRAKEFHSLHQQLNALLARLQELRFKHATASEDQRSEIQLQWKELIAKGEQLEPKLIEAAERAYAEAPNAEKEITDFLAMLLGEMVQADDYEPAAKIAKLLMDNNCSEKNVPNLAGIAAFAVSDFDAAEKYFDVAAGKGFFQSIAQDDKLAHVGWVCLGKIPYYKKAWAAEKTLRSREAKEDNLPRVLLKTTKGDIELELFEDQAPNTVANFISLVQRGTFYKDVPFHRVLQGFMAQSGDPTGRGDGGPGYTIACECYEPNHRNHFRGSLSMAHTDLRDTGGSQFFLTFMPVSHLDGKHTVFGRVIRGMDVLAKLQRRDPDDQEAPRPDKIIEAKVVRKRLHPYKPQVTPDLGEGSL